MKNEQNLISIYSNKRLMEYLRWKVDNVSSVITNVEKLEWCIFGKLVDYYEHVRVTDKRLSNGRLRGLIDREIIKALKEHRLQVCCTYSDLVVTDDFGESLEYDPEDTSTDVELDAEESFIRSWYKREIARLATDDFGRFVLKAWYNGSTDSEIAKELALINGGNFESLKVKISRFKKQCRLKIDMKAIAS